MLCLSVWSAVKHALSSVQKNVCPQLNLPATAEEILRRLTELKQQDKDNTVTVSYTHLTLPTKA